MNLTEMLREAKTRAAGNFETMVEKGRKGSKDMPEAVRARAEKLREAAQGEEAQRLYAAAAGLGKAVGTAMKESDTGRKVAEGTERGLAVGREAYERARGSDRSAVPPPAAP